MRKTCTALGCERDTSHGGNNLCSMHYQRLRRGSSIGPSGFILDPRRSNADRVYPRLQATGDSPEWDCWEWTGALRRGYGTVRVGKKLIYVHRWVYEDMIAPIPEDLVLDHTCLNYKCANPYHLDPVSIKENVARGGYSSGYRKAM